MEEQEPTLESASFKFTQESNCVSSDEYEEIIISCESDLGIDRTDGGFFVLKTEAWSVDGVEDLEKLFDRIRKVTETK